MSAEAAVEMPACLRDLLELSEGEEAELLADILTSGWDQGCFLRLDGDSPPPDLSPQRIEVLLEGAAGRPRPHPEGEIADPFEDKPLAEELPDDETSPSTGSATAGRASCCLLERPGAASLGVSAPGGRGPRSPPASPRGSSVPCADGSTGTRPGTRSALTSATSCCCRSAMAPGP